ncbi:MAG: cation:proton antiporter [Chloroflexota bacterium]
MTHDTDILFTITIAIVMATAGGYLAALLRLPPIAGFLTAGIIIGPFTPGPMASSEIATQLAEIGVILLMFGVGIHFSIKELAEVQAVSLPAAIIHTSLITAAVTLIFSGFGWSISAGILLGLAIAIASTVIVVHTYTRRNELDTPHAKVAIGWLIVEDLIAVLILVLYPAFVDGGGASTMELLEAFAVTMGKIIVLSLAMIVIGTRLVPQLLRVVSRTNSRELFLLSVLAIALGIAYTSAIVFDVSFALGAFLAGLVVSEADSSHQAAADALPFQEAFSVLFFVSVGMLFDPAFLLESPDMIAIAVVFIVLVRPVLTWIILSLLRFGTVPSMSVAASRAQIGEFSFILGSLGISLGVFDSDALSIILAGSIISILLNPGIFYLAERAQNWLRTSPAISRFELNTLGTDGNLLGAEESGTLRGHAVILGYGRVGSLIGEALQRRGFPIAIVEQNRRRVDQLRSEGMHAIFGDGSNPLILESLNLPRARVLIVAVSDPILTRLAVERARGIAPGLSIVVRTHSDEERARYNQMSNCEAVMGERELAIEMTRFALHRYGVSNMEIQAILRGIRFRDESQAEALSPRITDPIR